MQHASATTLHTTQSRNIITQGPFPAARLILACKHPVWHARFPNTRYFLEQILCFANIFLVHVLFIFTYYIKKTSRFIACFFFYDHGFGTSENKTTGSLKKNEIRDNRILIITKPITATEWKTEHNKRLRETHNFPLFTHVSLSVFKQMDATIKLRR